MGGSVWLQRWTMDPTWPSSRVTGMMMLATQRTLSPSITIHSCESHGTTGDTYRLATTLTLIHFLSICDRFGVSLGIDNNLKDVKQNRMWKGPLGDPPPSGFHRLSMVLEDIPTHPGSSLIPWKTRNEWVDALERYYCLTHLSSHLRLWNVVYCGGG